GGDQLRLTARLDGRQAIFRPARHLQVLAARRGGEGGTGDRPDADQLLAGLLALPKRTAAQVIDQGLDFLQGLVVWGQGAEEIEQAGAVRLNLALPDGRLILGELLGRGRACRRSSQDADTEQKNGKHPDASHGGFLNQCRQARVTRVPALYSQTCLPLRSTSTARWAFM